MKICRFEQGNDGRPDDVVGDDPGHAVPLILEDTQALQAITSLHLLGGRQARLGFELDLARGDPPEIVAPVRPIGDLLKEHRLMDATEGPRQGRVEGDWPIGEEASENVGRGHTTPPSSIDDCGLQRWAARTPVAPREHAVDSRHQASEGNAYRDASGRVAMPHERAATGEPRRDLFAGIPQQIQGDVELGTGTRWNEG
jgi:hypothetical protein